MTILDALRSRVLYFDGGMGTLLQKSGLRPGELPERRSLTHPEDIRKIHRAYLEAGCDIVTANTFGANILKYSEGELEAVISASIREAKAAITELGGERWVALDVGPTGKMLEPYGELSFEAAVEIFAKIVRLGVKHGADLILIETLNDAYEAKAALLAAKENSDLPVFVSCAFGSDGKLMTGADPLAMVTLLEGMGADAIGANCSVGPRALMPVIDKLLTYASVPVFVQPNAGMPRVESGETVFDVSPDEFAADVAEMIKKGVSAAGGCCGTTPQHIAALTALTKGAAAPIITDKNISAVSSYAETVIFGSSPVLIGERINPTGKKRFKEALRANDMDYLLKEAVGEEENGAAVLDVNVGLPELDEPALLSTAVKEIQGVTALPLQIDTADTVAMERALRIYNGKAMINSVNGKLESMEAVFPLAKKYGGLIVALTLDEQGIPETAEGRVEIAKKILSCAAEYGISKKNIIFDPLAMAVSADEAAPSVTLRSLELLREMGCLTSLGISNVSFGLPCRDLITSAFFSAALERGLSAAIMNPYSVDVKRAYYTYCALHGLDSRLENYISFASSLPTSDAVASPSVAAPVDASAGAESELERAIIKGLKSRAAALTAELLSEKEPMDIVNGELIPALNKVGEGFEKKTVYLPTLLMSAEAASAAFEVIKSKMPADESGKKHTVVVATVEGDIHDIGKNIVKLLLENYGYRVIDLGKNVSPSVIVETAKTENAALVGLSALMTTTVPAMEETVRLLHATLPSCKVMVGGAVLTQSYASKIGADFYSPDALGAVRFAESI